MWTNKSAFVTSIWMESSINSNSSQTTTQYYKPVKHSKSVPFLKLIQ